MIDAAQETFSLGVIHTDATHGGLAEQLAQDVPYNQLWQGLKDLTIDKRKYWVIGFNMRYILEKAALLQALETGEVELPRPKKAGSKRKRAGRLTMSANTLEIDLVVGKHELKLLDWRNYGIEPEDVLDSDHRRNA